MLFHGFLDVQTTSQQARDYLVDELRSGNQVRPFITYYKMDIPVFTATFPRIEEFEPSERARQREGQLSQLAWLNSNLGTDGMIFAIDSAIPTTTDDGIEYMQDVLLLFYANKMGAFVAPCAYIFSTDTQSVEWVDRKYDESSIIKSQTSIIAFFASQFFFTKPLLPLDGIISYLEESGFGFNFHEPYSRENIGVARDFLFI